MPSCHCQPLCLSPPGHGLLLLFLCKAALCARRCWLSQSHGYASQLPSCSNACSSDASSTAATASDATCAGAPANAAGSSRASLPGARGQVAHPAGEGPRGAMCRALETCWVQNDADLRPSPGLAAALRGVGLRPGSVAAGQRRRQKPARQATRGHEGLHAVLWTPDECKSKPPGTPRLLSSRGEDGRPALGPPSVVSLRMPVHPAHEGARGAGCSALKTCRVQIKAA